MFDPMYADDPLLQLVPLAIGIVGFVVGLYLIYRITKDIEDNERRT